VGREDENARMVSGIVSIGTEAQELWDSVAHEKNAVVSLSIVKPVLAMKFLQQVEDPSTQTEGTLPKMYAPMPQKRYEKNLEAISKD
jgi:hypothetical protein